MRIAIGSVERTHLTDAYPTTLSSRVRAEGNAAVRAEPYGAPQDESYG